MNLHQREKIEAAVDVIMNGHSDRNKYLEYGEAYDILKDYLHTYMEKKDLVKINNRKMFVDIEETEDTSCIMNIIQILLQSKFVRTEVKPYKHIESE